MNKEIKYRLIRTVSEFLIVTTLATGISHVATRIKYPKEQIPYTQEDTIRNLTFNEELNKIINQDQITFKNKELESIVKKKLNGPITKEGLELERGALCDVAPTMLHLLGIKKPKEMIGKNLIKNK